MTVNDFVYKYLEFLPTNKREDFKYDLSLLILYIQEVQERQSIQFPRGEGG